MIRLRHTLWVGYKACNDNSGGAAGKKTKFGGTEAYVMNYKASGKVKGRVWFALKNDKLYRVMLNWFVGEEKDFLPPFEKSVKSFKFQ